MGAITLNGVTLERLTILYESKQECTEILRSKSEGELLHTSGILLNVGSLLLLSSQVTSANDLVVQVVMIAESMRLQAVLQTYGIQTQTPSEIEPVQIWSQWEMVKVYQHLGRNEHLKLKGRPKRPIGSLGTSKVYRLSGQTILCYPLIFSHSDFYLAHDMALLTADIKSELQFVSRCWRLSGRPTVAILITENNMRSNGKDPQFPVMLEFLSQLRTGSVDNVKVRLGRLQNLIATSCLEHLDFLHNVDLGTPLDVECFKQLHNDHIGYQALTDIPKQRPIVEDKRDFKSEFENSSTSDILAALLGSFHLYGSIQMLGIILKREGPNFMVGDMSASSEKAINPKEMPCAILLLADR
eukprot:TCALIF_01806-PC protein Name:"Similar to CG8475 Probable phosphorylase b kinase regulatory subunit beta (Drosophila melanogaster)" AED:0.51 eAED:0.51 QI:0/0.4/0.33/0.66/1/1/6/0/355